MESGTEKNKISLDEFKKGFEFLVARYQEIQNRLKSIQDKYEGQENNITVIDSERDELAKSLQTVFAKIHAIVALVYDEYKDDLQTHIEIEKIVEPFFNIWEVESNPSPEHSSDKSLIQILRLPTKMEFTGQADASGDLTFDEIQNGVRGILMIADSMDISNVLESSMQGEDVSAALKKLPAYPTALIPLIKALSGKVEESSLTQITNGLHIIRAYTENGRGSKNIVYEGIEPEIAELRNALAAKLEPEIRTNPKPEGYFEVAAFLTSVDLLKETEEQKTDTTRGIINYWLGKENIKKIKEAKTIENATLGAAILQLASAIRNAPDEMLPGVLHDLYDLRRCGGMNTNPVCEKYHLNHQDPEGADKARQTLFNALVKRCREAIETRGLAWTKFFPLAFEGHIEEKSDRIEFGRYPDKKREIQVSAIKLHTAQHKTDQIMRGASSPSNIQETIHNISEAIPTLPLGKLEQAATLIRYFSEFNVGTAETNPLWGKSAILTSIRPEAISLGKAIAKRLVDEIKKSEEEKEMITNIDKLVPLAKFLANDSENATLNSTGRGTKSSKIKLISEIAQQYLEGK